MVAKKTLGLFIVVVMVTGALSAYQTCSPDWKEVGCKVDYHYNLTILIDDRQPDAVVKADWDNVNGYVHDLTCRCRAKANNDGFKWFVIEKSGICLSAAGDLSVYLTQHPLDDSSKCIGQITIHSSPAPDGSACVLGVYRGYFYSIEAPVVQSAPVQSSEEQASEEEVAHNPAPAPAEEEVAHNPAPAPAEEEAVASAPAAEQEEEVASNPMSGGEEEAVQSCNTAEDVFVVLDISGSVSYMDFAIEQQFSIQFLERFDLATSRFGIMTYDSEITSTLSWATSSSMTLDQIRTYINNIAYSGGSTYTAGALQEAKSQIVNSRRDGVSASVIIMTDGITWPSNTSLIIPSAELREVTTNVIAIGVGDYSMNELEIITGNNPANIITKSDFASLGSDMGAVLNNLIAKTCT